MANDVAVSRLISEQPELYSYHDYREYLRDLFFYYKTTDSQFSIRKFAKKAQIAVSFLSMVLAGRRNLSPKSLTKLLEVLSLSPAEQSYFRIICTISDSKSQAERMQAMAKLHKFKEYQKLNFKEIEAYKYLTHWYYVAIREMAALSDFSADPQWIQERLNYSVSISEVTKAVDFLIDHRFLERQPDGAIKAPNKTVQCWSGIYKLSQGEFHKQMFDRAGESIETVSSDLRNITSRTVAIPQTAIKDINKILESAYKKIESLNFGGRNRETVYHVSLACFPLTKPVKVGPNDKD